MADSTTMSLKDQGKAALVLVSLAILSVLGMTVLGILTPIVTGMIGVNSTENIATNNTIKTALTAFIAGLALFGTFATVTALIIVVKGIINIVKGLQ
jgi:hypothetical protein